VIPTFISLAHILLRLAWRERTVGPCLPRGAALPLGALVFVLGLWGFE
jgi:hypothetical protein